MYKIAICDDDKRYRKTIREIIEHENSLPENEIRFYEYESGNELLKHTDILHELVFIDIRMPGLDGNQTALKLRNYNKDAVLIFYSSYFEPTVDSINFGQPFRYIMKDLHDTSLRREIAAIMTEVSLWNNYTPKRERRRFARGGVRLKSCPAPRPRNRTRTQSRKPFCPRLPRGRPLTIRQRRSPSVTRSPRKHIPKIRFCPLWRTRARKKRRRTQSAKG